MADRINLVEDIFYNLKHSSENTALVINDQFYSYGELGAQTAGFYHLLSDVQEDVIGIYSDNSIGCYSAILSVLLAGKCYVILHPAYPENRNLKIVELAGLKTVVSTKTDPCQFLVDNGIRLINTLNCDLPHSVDSIQCKAIEQNNAYVIFTSGSTGEPKGVPITYGNLNAFYKAYQHIGWQLDANDRMLQMFELTFDVSVVSTLYPLAIGASIYTVDHADIKYLKIFELLEQYNLTFAAIAPSVLQLISPFFDEIDLPSLRYLVVTAEASQTELLERFSRCIPNAQMVNLYGPTEATIYCTYYQIPNANTVPIKQHNGMVAIGKPFWGTKVLITDEQGRALPKGEQGEMWVSGPQVMSGYFNDPEKTSQAMVLSEDGNLYYKTGDLCIMDDQEDIIYCGRKDYQVKIQGFRIELSEIEYTAKQFFEVAPNVVVIPTMKAGICSRIEMVVELESCSVEALQTYLKERLPHYMLPHTVHCLQLFPTTASNKIDRKEIAKIIHHETTSIVK